MEEEQEEELEKEEEKEEEQEEPVVEEVEEKPAERKVSFPAARRERKKFGVKGKRRLGLVLVLVVLAVAGWFIFARQKKEKAPEPTVEPATNEASPTPTTKPVEKGEVRIQVLNGTGIAKEASFLQEKLGDLGYTKVELGNAESEDFVVTKATFVSSLSQEVIKEITSELEKIYDEVDAKTTDTKGDYLVQIITGYRKGHTPTPTQTPSPTPTESQVTPTSTPSATPTP